ncbi:hypothetical protein JJC03_09265 [Flavobacterium oreochromis]|uniref:hypothetical protein n=1 Tax=Flavobacterium oreochromis TaxID=2906078 RepID=UPI001CE4C1DB|nr:hypothetical protein [Flavobacterium oreochromis]QYS85427.1 hypothetical protein JJC03_09265 [Flavobacterium oreochromis]
MDHYEEVLKLLHDKFGWNLTNSLTATGKKLVADTIEALKNFEHNKNKKIKLEVTEAQLNAIMNLTDDISAMVGGGVPAEKASQTRPKK